jgi:hypothetical protein
MRTALVSSFSVFALMAGSFLLPAPANAVEPSKNWKIGIKMTENYERGHRTGVKIIEIFDDSPAERVGLRPRDVLHSINGRLFNDPFAVRSYVMDNDHKVLYLIYQRRGDFYEQRVELEYGIVTMAAPAQGGGTRTVQKKVLRKMEAKGAPKKVADPRGKVKESGQGPRKVSDPRNR